MTHCSECGQHRPDVTNRPDPFEQDVNGRTVYRDLCDDCTATLAEEI